MRRILPLLLALFLVAPALGARYVNPTGTDTGDCTDSGSPCRTISYAAGKAGSGETVWVQDGTYTETTSCPQYGSAVICLDDEDRNPATTIRAVNKGGAILRGGGWAVAALVGSDGWTFRDLQFGEPSDDYGADKMIQATVSDRITLDGVVSYRTITEYGTLAFVAGCADLTIRDSEFHWVTGQECNWPGADSAQTWLEGAEVSNLVVEGNLIEYASRICSCDDVQDAVWRRNTIQTWDNHGIQAGGRGWLIENNIFTRDHTTQACLDYFNNGGENVQSRAIDIYEIEDAIIRNNLFTVHGVAGKPVGWETYAEESQTTTCTDDHCDHSNIAFYNNLFYQWVSQDGAQPNSPGGFIRLKSTTDAGDPAAVSFSEIRIDGNLYADSSGQKWNCGPASASTDTFATWQGFSCPGMSGSPDANGTTNEPSFLDFAGGDYRPSDASAAQVDGPFATQNMTDDTDVDSRGVHYCASTDFDGNLRNDGACDIGPFELQQPAGLIDDHSFEEDSDGWKFESDCAAGTAPVRVQTTTFSGNYALELTADYADGQAANRVCGLASNLEATSTPVSVTYELEFWLRPTALEYTNAEKIRLQVRLFDISSGASFIKLELSLGNYALGQWQHFDGYTFDTVGWDVTEGDLGLEIEADASAVDHSFTVLVDWFLVVQRTQEATSGVLLDGASFD